LIAVLIYKMNFRGYLILVLFIISGFLFRNEQALAKTAMAHNEYKECKLRASTDTRTHNNSRLLINENSPAQVLHTRIMRTVHIIKSNSIITGTLLGVHQYLKHTFYTSDDHYIPSAELLLFPHHAFW
jgi:hypothetical protein